MKWTTEEIILDTETQYNPLASIAWQFHFID